LVGKLATRVQSMTVQWKDPADKKREKYLDVHETKADYSFE